MLDSWKWRKSQYIHFLHVLWCSSQLVIRELASEKIWPAVSSNNNVIECIMDQWTLYGQWWVYHIPHISISFNTRLSCTLFKATGSLFLKVVWIGRTGQRLASYSPYSANICTNSFLKSLTLLMSTFVEWVKLKEIQWRINLPCLHGDQTRALWDSLPYRLTIG